LKPLGLIEEAHEFLSAAQVKQMPKRLTERAQDAPSAPIGTTAKEAVLKQMGFGKLLQGGLSRPLRH
jgi:hypothetical protein